MKLIPSLAIEPFWMQRYWWKPGQRLPFWISRYSDLMPRIYQKTPSEVLKDMVCRIQIKKYHSAWCKCWQFNEEIRPEVKVWATHFLDFDLSWHINFLHSSPNAYAHTWTPWRQWECVNRKASTRSLLQRRFVFLYSNMIRLVFPLLL